MRTALRSAAGLSLALAVFTAASAETPRVPPAKLAFGQIAPPSDAEARAQCEAWLKASGPYDAAAFAKIWDAPDRTTFERVTATLALGSPDAARLLAESRAAGLKAPKEIPAVLKDAKTPAFLRANLALAYARNLSAARVYEEALEALKLATPEYVADPAAYYFHRAVAEYSTMQKDEATRSIVRLLDDVQGGPARYRMVATLMYLDMESWSKDAKHPGNLTRLMDNSERRLDLARGGKVTQEIQKKIVINLDENIKQIEEQIKQMQKKQGKGGGQGSQPQQDSQIAKDSGPGNVTEQKLKKMAENWGKMPEQERARALVDITRDLHPRYREVIENHFRSLSKSQSAPR